MSGMLRSNFITVSFLSNEKFFRNRSLLGLHMLYTDMSPEAEYLIG